MNKLEELHSIVQSLSKSEFKNLLNRLNANEKFSSKNISYRLVQKLYSMKVIEFSILKAAYKISH